MAIKLLGFRGELPRVAAELLPDTAAAHTRNVRLTSGDLEPYDGPTTTADSLSPRGGDSFSPADIKTMRVFYDEDGTRRWLLSDHEISVAVGFQGGENQRFVYTVDDDDDEPPKITDFNLWFDAAVPSGYNLGLSLPPDDVILNGPPSATQPQPENYDQVAAGITDISTIEPTHVWRGPDNTARLTFAAPHGLRTGDVVSIYGFGTSELARADVDPQPTEDNFKELQRNYSLNGTNVGIIATDENTIEYPSFGEPIGSKTDPVDIKSTSTSQQGILFEKTGEFPKVELSGNPQVRTYVYTWVSPFGGESLPSPASVDFVVKEGQTVTIGNLPVGPPAGDDAGYWVRGIRLYRSVTTPTEQAYFLLKTLWFPNLVSAIAKGAGAKARGFDKFETLDAGNIRSDPYSDKLGVLTRFPHSLVEGDQVFFNTQYTTGSFTDFNNHGDRAFEVIEVVDQYRFVIDDPLGASSLRGNGVSTGDATLYYDASEGGYEFPNGGTPRPARKWSTAGFVDDFRLDSLSQVLESQDYDPPPKNMKGVKLAHNGMLMGFFDNVVCFSEPDTPNAWPERHRLTLESDIVALVPVSGFILALTVDYPYRINGQTPESMAFTKIDQYFPCESSRSVVEIKGGAMWASLFGIALYTPFRGMSLVTERLYDPDRWGREYDPKSITAVLYKEKYLAAYETPGAPGAAADRQRGSFLIDSSFTERDDLLFTKLSLWFKAVTVGRDGKLYYISNEDYSRAEQYPNADYKIKVFDDSGVPARYEWTSKVFVLDKPMALGAGKVEADSYLAPPTYQMWFGTVAEATRAKLLNSATTPFEEADLIAMLAEPGMDDVTSSVRYLNSNNEEALGTAIERLSFEWDSRPPTPGAEADDLVFASNLPGAPIWNNSNIDLYTDPGFTQGHVNVGQHPGNVSVTTSNGDIWRIRVDDRPTQDLVDGALYYGLISLSVLDVGLRAAAAAAAAAAGIKLSIYPNKTPVPVNGVGGITPADDRPFRLPWGIKTDTYQVKIEASSRVRRVVLAENPRALERN